MAPLTIDVSGQSIISRHPERAVLFLDVKSDGPEQEIVSKDVTTTSNNLHQHLKELLPKYYDNGSPVDGPVESFSSTLLRTWSAVPTDDKNKPLDRVYYATSSFEVVFYDFKKLSEIVGKLVAQPKVEINSIEWRLAEATKKELGSESRKLAMRDAIDKANDYAEVIGREVVAVEINDGDSTPNEGRRRYMMARSSPTRAHALDYWNQDVTPFDLNPKQIEFKGSVRVKFEAVAEE